MGQNRRAERQNRVVVARALEPLAEDADRHALVPVSLGSGSPDRGRLAMTLKGFLATLRHDAHGLAFESTYADEKEAFHQTMSLNDQVKKESIF